MRAYLASMFSLNFQSADNVSSSRNTFDIMSRYCTFFAFMSMSGFWSFRNFNASINTRFESSNALSLMYRSARSVRRSSYYNKVICMITNLGSSYRHVSQYLTALLQSWVMTRALPTSLTKLVSSGLLNLILCLLTLIRGLFRSIIWPLLALECPLMLRRPS